jgi:hypothetical protein
MPSTITGGAFQDALGNPLADGYLIFQLSQDAQVSSTQQVVAGYKVTIPLDGSGNASGEVWANDLLSPAGTFYNVSAYSAEGQLVWGPNPQQVFSSPSPFNLGTWVPGTVNTIPPTSFTLTNVTLTSSATSGSATLPGNPVAFLTGYFNGQQYKIALYNV